MSAKKHETINLPEGLPAGKLRSECDPDSLGFKLSSEVKEEAGLVGQERAIDAIRLAAGIAHKDFNLYVLGRPGTGRNTAVTKLLSEQATTRSSPFDWVYVNNFDAPHKPNAMKLPQGVAPRLKSAMQDLVDDLAIEIPTLFESEEYQTQRRAIEEEFGDRHEEPIGAFAEVARAEDIALLKTPMGFMLSAMIDGKPIDPDAYEALPPEERRKIDETIERLQDQLASVLSQGPQLEKEHRQKVEKLNAEMAERAVSMRVQDVVGRFNDIAGVEAYLEQVRQDMISNAELFLAASERSGNGPFPEVSRKYHSEPRFDRYAVNVMVSHGAKAAAPVIREDLPTLSQLTGRIEHISEMGTLITNFTLIKPGALHRANGGYLILDARRVLNEPYAWDALKRCLQARSISITSLSDRLGLASTVSLEPDPIPLDVRVVLIGDRLLHMLLVMLDPEFGELFKLQADFNDDMPRSQETTGLMAHVMAANAQREKLRPMTAAAIAALLDHAVRLADDATKFTLQVDALKDAMREADYYAGQETRDLIERSDIDKAIKAADLRAARVRERMQEAITRKTILIDTAGEAIGQVNGLSVIGLGPQSFGHPSRITARVRMGAGKLIDIEREVELGGPLHSKGVLILGGYLASTYALGVPMSLHASLVFEQNYGGIEGDSASSAELYALLSALSGLPIRQGIAATGSVNQSGQVQAIGGVNEKIEGFFDICKARRLTGNQGVLIPASNVDYLMLRPDVVEAARAGKFRIIAVSTIDEGIEILTGRRAGKRRRGGAYPEGTVNRLVEDRLLEFAQMRQRFAEPPDSDPGKDRKS